jgi:hypothetical protein
VRQTLVLALACAALLVVSGLVVVGLRVQQVHLGYRLDGLRAERGRLEVLVRQLEVEVATLRSPGRLEGRARQLGLVSPTREQVRLAREFVSGETGMAATERGRVAALELPPRPEPRARVPLQP